MHKYNNFVKVQFEIGHEASLRSEVTPQGFTHDWQVFVRGADNAEIHHFVEKVVFYLHESFPKPKRVVKEPPYEVRESGYASFSFPIEVYLKTKEEPRKLDFTYDLTLNISTTTHNSQREKRIFNNPSEEFRRKLIRGGGVGVGSDMLPLTDHSQNTDDKSSSKKSSSDSSKKHKSKDSLKPEDVRSRNQFADLFGTPIKTAKLSPTTAPKKPSESKHSSDLKVASKSISKHSPLKEKEKDKESSKKDTMITSSSKEKDKERDRSKEKDKKAEKSLKRPPSPVAVAFPPKILKEEVKKSSHEEVKEKVKSSSADLSKNEKKEKKKDKKSRDDKDKKDRHKEHESKKEQPPAAPPPLPPPVVEKEKVERLEKIKTEFKELKENVKKSPKNIIKEEKFKEKSDKEKIDPIEKQRHKHKKKEKNKKDEKELKEKEKSGKKIEKPPPAPPVVVPREPSPPPQPPKSRVRSPSPKISKNPLGTLLAELPEKESDSESSGDEDAKSVEKVKMTPPPIPPPAPAPPVARTPERVKEEKFAKEKMRKKEKKSSSKDEDGLRKKKRKIKEKDEVIPEKTSKLKVEEEQKIMRDDPMDEDIEERLSEPSPVGSPQREDQEISRSRSPTPPIKFTEEYVMELKDLQQKIMTLEDNAELQRVVQVIAETGLYEITKKTFDFDLCALDKSTVKRLQDLFFAAS